MPGMVELPPWPAETDPADGAHQRPWCVRCTC